MNRVIVQGTVIGPGRPRESRNGNLYWKGGLAFRRVRYHYVPVTAFGRVATWMARFAGQPVAVEGVLEDADRGDYRTLAVIASDMVPLKRPVFESPKGWPVIEGSAEVDLSGWLAVPPRPAGEATLLRLKFKVPLGREWRSGFATVVVHGEDLTDMEKGAPVFVRGVLQQRFKKKGVDVHALEVVPGLDRERYEAREDDLLEEVV